MVFFKKPIQLAFVISIFVLCAFFIAPTIAQTASDEAEKSSFITYIEEQISTDDFKISLNGLEGSLSSNVNLSSITIADKEGVWLTITNPKLVWTRSSLLTGKVDVDSLSAEHIDLTRLPNSNESLPSPEAKPFQLPDLPVAIILNKLEIEKVSFAKPVFGLEAQASVKGKLLLDEGNLDADFVIDRLDGVGGNLTTTASFASATQNLNLNLTLSEPADGIAANLLNLEDRPPVFLAIVGEGPVADLNIGLSFNVESRSILEGKLTLKEVEAGQKITANLQGPLASILPAIHRPFFGNHSVVSTNALLEKGGAINLNNLSVSGGDLDLKANAQLLADGFLNAIDLDISLISQSSDRVTLPTSGGDTTLRSLNLDLKYDAANSDGWKANIATTDVFAAGQRIRELKLSADGTVENISSPSDRRGAFRLAGQLNGFETPDEGLQEILGSTIQLIGTGRWAANQPLALNQLRLANDNIDANVAGQIEGTDFDGDLQLNIKRLAAFSKIANTALAGSASLRISGIIEALTGGFRLKLDGIGREIVDTNNPLKKLLQGGTTLSGSVSRGENGLEFDSLRLANKQFQTTINGTFGSEFANLVAQAKLNDLNYVTTEAQGPLEISANISGNGSPYNVKSDLAVSSGALVGKNIRGLAAQFSGTVNKDVVIGSISGKGSLEGKPIILSATINRNEEVASADDLIVQIAESRISGSGQRKTSGLMTGNLTVSSTNISDLAALALVEASGAVNGSVELFETGDMQSIKTNIKAKGLAYSSYRIGSADIIATIVDAFNQPKIGATIIGKNIQAAGINAPTLNAEIGTQGDETSFGTSLTLDLYSARIQSSGTLKQSGGEARLQLNTFDINSRLTNASLQRPATIINANGTTRLNDINLSIGKGSVVVNGTAGARLNIDTVVRDLPLAIINAIRPQTGATGTLSGSIKASGAPSNPDITFNIKTAGLSVQELRTAGLTPLNGSANGRFSNNTVILSSLAVRNAQNVNLAASGSIPLAGGGLRIAADGSVPLSLAKSALSSRGASATGTANFNVNASGSLAAPNLSGLVSVNNAIFSDPLSNLRLTNIELLAGLQRDRITINKGRASLSSGGAVSISGSVGIRGDFPADLTIALQGARYTDGQTFNTTANGSLTVTGNLQGNPTLGGTINLSKTEVSLPESVASSAKLLDVTHVNPGNATRETLARLDKVTPKARPTSRPSILNLNLSINAPNRIFIRGRGVDSELGGNIRITGPVNNITPNGSFRLIRGRIAIIGRRLDLSQGTVTLSGNLDPNITLVATTRVDGYDANINIKGRASEPKITFTSSPELPEDEVLALIIFGKSITDLSPAQIVRLASIANELTGGNGPGIVGGLRGGAGLDDLDVVQDESGNTAVKAGKYISDDIYVGVQAGKKSEATINLDITDEITARGTMDSEGQTGIGIFLEKDY